MDGLQLEAYQFYPLPQVKLLMEDLGILVVSLPRIPPPQNETSFGGLCDYVGDYRCIPADTVSFEMYRLYCSVSG